jgi:hypothetical protein
MHYEVYSRHRQDAQASLLVAVMLDLEGVFPRSQVGNDICRENYT